ncbi:type IV pilus modification protein PilV [Guyparkeria sp. GHLCS8-2]|jgi:type IV pilus assembly protein PilV|uniref:type IV pilus modification protein PilV n=1 Tax=Guyparkeria halopsychrophila TaxID=3139421 RepID=UPI0037CAE715
MQLMNKYIPDSKRQAGVGLIEILIAVLVLSIGFLGMAALQTKALSNNNSAMDRTQATIASYSILDAMRADRANVLNGNYNTTVTVGSCPGAGGTLASVQLDRWCTGSTGVTPPDGLAALGTGATGEISCDGNGICEITVTFDDDKATGGSSAQEVVTRARL